MNFKDNFTFKTNTSLNNIGNNRIQNNGNYVMTNINSSNNNNNNIAWSAKAVGMPISSKQSSGNHTPMSHISNNSNNINNINNNNYANNKTKSSISPPEYNDKFLKSESNVRNYNNNNSNNNKNNNNNKNSQWEKNLDLAYYQIKSRRDKLLQEKTLLSKIPYNPKPITQKNDISSLYTYENLNKNRDTIANRNYNYQMMEPIYYPLEMPVHGEPVKLPNFDMGTVPTECGNIHPKLHYKGISKYDQLAILALLLKKDQYDFDFDIPDLDFTKLNQRRDVNSMDEYKFRVGTQM